jgi:hypothetical protein
MGQYDKDGQRKHQIHCKSLLDECAVFIKDEENGKLGAEAGCHDDHVIAAALAVEGDSYLPKCEQIKPEKKGWRERQREEARANSVWAA